MSSIPSCLKRAYIPSLSTKWRFTSSRRGLHIYIPLEACFIFLYGGTVVQQHIVIFMTIINSNSHTRRLEAPKRSCLVRKRNNRRMTEQAMSRALYLKTIAGVFSKANEHRGYFKQLHGPKAKNGFYFWSLRESWLKLGVILTAKTTHNQSALNKCQKLY